MVEGHQGMDFRTVQRTSIVGIVAGTKADLVTKDLSIVQDHFNPDEEVTGRTSVKNVDKTSEQVILVDPPFLVAFPNGIMDIGTLDVHQEDDP